MTSTDSNTETRFVPGLLLCFVGLLGLFARWVPVLTQTTIMIGEFPAAVALVCGYCAIVVILSSAIDHFDGDAAVGACHLIGRWFMWGGVVLAAFFIALMATHTLYADDLLSGAKSPAVAAITAVLLAASTYLLQRPRPAATPATRKQSGARNHWLKNGLAIVLCLAASTMLYQRYAENQARDLRYAAEEDAARRSGKPWVLDMEAVHGGMSVDEIRALAQTTGHTLKCYSDLRSEERLRRDDRANCWTPLGIAWGEPALLTMFAFGDDGLRNQLLRFPETSWPQVQQKLDQMGQRLPQTFGIDPETKGAIFGWRLNSGLVFSAAPPKGEEVGVLWTAKRDVAIDHCPHQGAASRSNPNGYSVPIAQLWPEIDCTKLR